MLSHEWCGKHAPYGSGKCPRHADMCFIEHHSQEIKSKFGPKAMFFCPLLECNEIAWDVDRKAGYKPRTSLIQRYGLNAPPEIQVIIQELLVLAIRQEAFLLKFIERFVGDGK